MHAIGVVVLMAVACYVAFMAFDTVGITIEQARARVISTGYRAAGRSYVTQIVNNRPYVLARVVPDMFLAEVDINGRIVQAAVEKNVHDRLRAGDDVRVTYRRTRLTRRTDVIAIE